MAISYYITQSLLYNNHKISKAQNNREHLFYSRACESPGAALLRMSHILLGPAGVCSSWAMAEYKRANPDASPIQASACVESINNPWPK